MTTQDIGDRFIADLIAEFEQFSLNALIAPTISTRQSHHQSFDFSISSRTSPAILLPIRPFPAHQFTMSAENRLGFHDTNHLP